ncbi:MAG: amidohydrolase family protein [Candidatus Woesearchaeota archaeon]
MIIDFHCHIGKDNEGPHLRLDELRASMKKNGIDKAVVFPFDTSDMNLIDESLALLKEDDLFPFLRFNPNSVSADALSDLIPGFAGVKLHPRAQNFFVDDPQLFPLYRVMAKEGLPLLLHADEAVDQAHPKRIINLARVLPELNIVMAHFFGNAVQFLQEVALIPNLYVDISINARTLRMEQGVREGVKFIFASDAPFDSQRVPIVKVEECRISEEEKEKIFSGYAQDLLMPSPSER